LPDQYVHLSGDDDVDDVDVDVDVDDDVIAHGYSYGRE
jgi:hypothetical protein